MSVVYKVIILMWYELLLTAAGRFLHRLPALHRHKQHTKLVHRRTRWDYQGNREHIRYECELYRLLVRLFQTCHDKSLYNVALQKQAAQRPFWITNGQATPLRRHALGEGMCAGCLLEHALALVCQPEPTENGR